MQRKLLSVLTLIAGVCTASANTASNSIASSQCDNAINGNIRGEMTVAIQQGHDSDGVIEPIPNLNKQSCDYPNVSFRTFEQGTVVLTVELLADGTVGNLELAEPSPHFRLNVAAAQFVSGRLQFVPATKNGIPITVERPVSVSFRIVSDPLWFTAASLQDPSPSDRIALGLDSLRWGMSLEQVKQVLPSLRIASFPGLPLTNQTRYDIDDYPHAGCPFHLILYFAAGHLSSVRFDSDLQCPGVAIISRQIAAELTARYGDAAFRTTATGGADADWTGPVTRTRYSFIRLGGISRVEVSFSATNGPPLMITDANSPYPPPASQ